MALSCLAAPLSIGTIRLPNRVFLAPLSGISDAPMRARALSHGAGMVVSEMIASGELMKGKADSARRLRRPDVAIHVVQLAGREAPAMAEAARIAVGEGADMVDINMGCPAKKVTGGYCGSALMRDPDHALSLIEAVAAAVDVPVTVKMRLGWDEMSLNAPDIARRAEAAGVRMIVVHGRTRCQFYKGHADWAAVAAVTQAVSVPVVVNGDVVDARSACEAQALSGAAAVMVGRAHCGAPWAAGAILGEISGTTVPQKPRSARERAGYVIAHYEEMLTHYGTGLGVRHARKHLGWYLDREPAVAPALRHTIMTGTDPATVMSALSRAFDEADDPVKRAAA